MKPEVEAALKRFENDNLDFAPGSATYTADCAALALIRAELERAEHLCIEAIQAMSDTALERLLFCPSVDIDAIYERRHVHYLGGSGHGGTVPV